MSVLDQVESELKDHPEQQEKVVSNKEVRDHANDLDRIRDLKNLVSSDSGKILIQYLQDDCIGTIRRLRSLYTERDLSLIIPLIAKLDAKISLLEEIFTTIKTEEPLEEALRSVISRIIIA